MKKSFLSDDNEEIQGKKKNCCCDIIIFVKIILILDMISLFLVICFVLISIKVMAWIFFSLSIIFTILIIILLFTKQNNDFDICIIIIFVTHIICLTLVVFFFLSSKIVITWIFCFLSIIFSITLIILYCGCCRCTCCTFNFLYDFKFKNEFNIYYLPSSDKNCKIISQSQSFISEDNKPLANMIQNNFDKTMKINYNKDNKNNKDYKNYKDKKENNRQIEIVDIIYLIDSTGSMGEETKNASKIVIANSEHFKRTYPKIDFQFGIIYYNDPIDALRDFNKYFQLTKDLEQIKNFCDNWINQDGGDGAEDWVGGYKLALDEINWRNGRKIIYHICDAPAHGRKYSKEFDDNHQEEIYEKELDTLMERCALKGIEIVGYYSNNSAKDSFEECKKIYDSKNGKSFQIEKYNKSNIVLSKTS